MFRAVSVFPGPFTLEAAEAVAGPGAGRWCCGWWTARCWCRRGKGLMAGGGMRCWRRCAPTGPGCWPAPGSRTRPRPRWPGGRWRWPSRPRRGCRPSRGRRPRSGGWMPRTPPWPRCWPGAWTMMRGSRCGWRSRWRRGGSCGAGWRVSTRCCARSPGAPCRAVTGGAPRSSGSAAWRGSRVMRPRRWVISPRCGTRPPSGGRPGCWPTAWPGGRQHCPRWAGTPRRPARPAAPWRWPGSSAYPAAEAVALANLGVAALDAGDQDRAVRLARQAAQITDGVPGWRARWVSYNLADVLIEAGDLAAAEPVCAATLARARDAGDLFNQAGLLALVVTLDLEAGRLQDAAAHLREALQLATRTGHWNETGNALDCCGLLCAATGRPAEAVTVWAARAALLQHQEIPDRPAGGAPPGGTAAPGPAGARTRPDPGGRRTRRGDEPGHRGRVRSAAHRSRPAAAGGRARGRSAPGNGSWSSWSPGAAPTRRSPRSCTSASAPSAPTWTGSGTRPAAAAAPT